MKNSLLSLLLSISIYCFPQQREIYLGADLSSVNEIEAAGAFYKSRGKRIDPYSFFKEKGCNLIRLRLWHSPQQNKYCGFEDVKRSIKRAKDQDMKVLLAFHYSDTWADPDRQEIPKAWEGIADVKVLGDSVYNYTLITLLKLKKENLLPDIVQVGNEINLEVLQPKGTLKSEIDWHRNSFLINKGIKGVRDASRDFKKDIQIMLNIAQPENALWWFDSATKNNITDYDWIGISYHPFWSIIKFNDLEESINTLISTYKKKVLIAETSYPYTLVDIDKCGNILGKAALIDDYPATPDGQRKYMIDLTKTVLAGGGSGVIYWEPAWVTSSCKTPWGIGSTWDNATFFDSHNNNEALPAFSFFDIKNYPQKEKFDFKYIIILISIILIFFLGKFIYKRIKT